MVYINVFMLLFSSAPKKKRKDFYFERVRNCDSLKYLSSTIEIRQTSEKILIPGTKYFPLEREENDTVI